jgi:hypothetical protein
MLSLHWRGRRRRRWSCRRGRQSQDVFRFRHSSVPFLGRCAILVARHALRALVYWGWFPWLPWKRDSDTLMPEYSTLIVTVISFGSRFKSMNEYDPVPGMPKTK